MYNNQKRFRQASLFESFANNKRAKVESNMNEGSDNQKLAISEEKMSPSLSCSPELSEFLIICEAAGDSNINESSDNQQLIISKEKMSPSPESLIVCEAAEDSMIIKTENTEANPETSLAETEIYEIVQVTDGSYQFSDDLFPSVSTVEESVPSSSHSADLFPEFESQSATAEPNDSSSDSDTDEIDAMSLLNTKPNCSLPLPKMEPSSKHSIMFSPHIRPGDAPRPYPSSYRDKWDSDHVRMPCSPQSRYPVKNAYGEERIVSRWDLICRSLRRGIETSEELEEAIMAYNTQYIGKWSFEGLHAFINKSWNEAERDYFFESILPKMINMALDLPNICTQPVPLLKEDKDHYVTMSQKQIGCLLLNAFFCMFPRRNVMSKRNKREQIHEYAFYPDINFNRLFFGVKNTISQRNAEKLKCLFNYFRRITSEEPCGTVTFHRQCLKTHQIPMWYSSTRGIRTAVIRSSGFIETDGKGMLQVDFANKFVGGGVLGQGCVQEEIRFVICPELIVTRLFVERLNDTETLIVTGVEQYNEHSGYADNFKWEGDFKDHTPRDSWGRRYTELLAMDATHFRTNMEQFKLQCLRRELVKAYCGFYEEAPPVHLSAIATGNWGCGAFKGNPNLKFLIQLMAASEAGRCLVYFTFGDRKLKAELQKMYDFLNDKNLAVGDVWRLLMNYIRHVSSVSEKIPNLYDFIYDQFVTRRENSKKKDSESLEDHVTSRENSKKRDSESLEDRVTSRENSKKKDSESHENCVTSWENSKKKDSESLEDQFLDDSVKEAMNKVFEDTVFSTSSTEIADNS